MNCSCFCCHKSTIDRNKGNKLYMSAFASGINGCLKESRLLKALNLYEKSMKLAAHEDAQACTSWNISLVYHKIYENYMYQNEKYNTKEPKDIFNYTKFTIEESYTSAIDAYVYGYKCKTNEWKNKIIEKLLLFHIILIENIMIYYQEKSNEEKLKKINELKRLASFIQHKKRIIYSIPYDKLIIIKEIKHKTSFNILKDIAEYFFYEAVCYYSNSEKDKNNNSTICSEVINNICSLLNFSNELLQDLKNTYTYMEYVETDFVSIDNDVNYYLCMLESLKYFVQANELENQIIRIKNTNDVLSDIEFLNNGAWDVIDLLKQAVTCTHGKDLQNEAVYLFRIGRVYEDIFQADKFARRYYKSSISLILPTSENNVQNELWFKELCQRFQKLQEKSQISEEVEKRKEKQIYLNELKEELKEINEKSIQLEIKPFIFYLFQLFMGQNLAKNERFLRTLENSTTMTDKKLLFHAMTYYHPDKQGTSDINRWTVLCGEISVFLNKLYERRFKQMPKDEDD